MSFQTTEILQRGDDKKIIADDLKQTLLSVAFFHIFYRNQQNAWKDYVKRPLSLLHNKTGFHRQIDLEVGFDFNDGTFMALFRTSLTA